MSVRLDKRRNPKTGVETKRWLVDVDLQHSDGSRQRVRKISPVQTKRGAEKFERELRSSLANGNYSKEGDKNKNLTLKCFAKEFMNIYATNNNKPSEAASKESMLRIHILPLLGSYHLAELSTKEFEYYKAQKTKEGLKAKTVKNHLACLRKMLNVAKEWGYINSVPIIKNPPVPKADFDFLSFEESERLINVCEGQLLCMVTVALHTGLRIGELRALHWQDVDLVAGRLSVKRSAWKKDIGSPKSGRSREIPLNSVAMRALQAHKHLRGPLVFSKPNGKLLGEQDPYRPLAYACKGAGLRKIAWHTLRHSFASHLVMRGQPLKAVQEFLGHASMEMTMRYAHLSPEVGKAAVEALVQPLRQHDGNNNLEHLKNKTSAIG